MRVLEIKAGSGVYHNALNVYKSYTTSSLLSLFIGLLVLLPLFILHPFRTGNVMYFYLSVVNLVGALGLVFFKKSISIRPSDIFLIFYIILGVLSFQWANNGSLVWFQVFGYLQLGISLLLVRSFWGDIKFRNFILFVLCITVITSFVQVVIFFLLKPYLDTVYPWHLIFGHNPNYVSSYFIALCCPVIYFLKKYGNYGILLTIFLAIMFYLMYLSTSLGSMIALMVLLPLMMIKKFTKRIRRGYFFFFLLVMIAVISFLVLDGNDVLNYSSRAFMLKSSLQIFYEYPLTGIGLGNWHTEAFKTMPVEYSTTKLPKMGNHIIYSQILSELGILGAFFYVFFFGSIIYFNSDITKPSRRITLIILLLYLLASLFYQVIHHYPYNFSKLQLVAFCSIGVLTYDKRKNLEFGRLGNWLLTGTSIVTLCFFFFSFKAYSACDELNVELHSGNINSLSIERYYNNNYFNNCERTQNLTYQLGSFYQDKDSIKTLSYYEQALKNNPYDDKSNLAIAEYFNFIEYKEETQESIVQEILVRKENIRAALLLASIYIDQEKYKDASSLLSISSNNYRFYRLLLQQSMYGKGYIRNLFVDEQMYLKFQSHWNQELSNITSENLLNYKKLLVNHMLTSKQARSDYSKFKRHVLNFERVLKSYVSSENYIRYLKHRYESYARYEYNKLLSVNNDFTGAHTDLRDLIEGSMIDYCSFAHDSKKQQEIKTRYMESLSQQGLVHHGGMIFLDYLPK